MSCRLHDDRRYPDGRIPCLHSSHPRMLLAQDSPRKINLAETVAHLPQRASEEVGETVRFSLEQAPSSRSGKENGDSPFVMRGRVNPPGPPFPPRGLVGDVPLGDRGELGPGFSPEELDC